jgi:hypothetical protein
MPHYQDGTQAKTGDLVVGKTYNMDGRTIVGTVLEVIPGTDSCNLRVAFADISTRPDATVDGRGIVYGHTQPAYLGVQSVIKAAYDYGETKAFKLIERATTPQWAIDEARKLIKAEQAVGDDM